MNKLLNMLLVCDSVFPIGGFSLSDGLETFVQQKRIKNKLELKEYINSYLSVLPYNDLGVCALASKTDDIEMLDVYYTASKTAMEIRKGSEKLCKRFIKIIEKQRDYKSVINYKKLIHNGVCNGHHSVVMGLYIKDTKADLKMALTALCYNKISSAITNSVKLIPLSQLDGQEVLFDVFENIEKAVEIACKVSLEEIGINGFMFDVRAMEHETLYSRLYMS